MGKRRKDVRVEDATSCIEAIRAVLAGSDERYVAVRVEPTTWPLNMILPKLHKYVEDGGVVYVQDGIGVDADLMIGFQFVEERDGYAVYRKASGDGDSPGADDEHV